MEVEDEIAGFIDKFAPPMQKLVRECRSRLHTMFPDAVQLIYDNDNFFVIGFGPTTRASDSVFSLACQRKGINLCFLQRASDLPDPTGILRGNGKVVRNVRLESADDLDRPDIRALIDAELSLSRVRMDSGLGPEVVVKSVSAKQRPRR